MKSLDNHYTEMGIEPIVYSDSNNLDPYQHTIIKYVTRWRVKGKLRDLKAAQLILQKYIDKEEKPVIPNELTALRDVIEEIALNTDKKYDKIVTVGRGGLWAASNIAYALDIPHVETYPLEEIEQFSSETTLFVDGVVDSGKTITNLIIDSVALYVRDTTERWPTYHGAIVPHSNYVKMPMSTPFDKGNECIQ